MLFVLFVQLAAYPKKTAKLLCSCRQPVQYGEDCGNLPVHKKARWNGYNYFCLFLTAVGWDVAWPALDHRCPPVCPLQAAPRRGAHLLPAGCQRAGARRGATEDRLDLFKHGLPAHAFALPRTAPQEGHRRWVIMGACGLANTHRHLHKLIDTSHPLTFIWALALWCAHTHTHATKTWHIHCSCKVRNMSVICQYVYVTSSLNSLIPLWVNTHRH